MSTEKPYVVLKRGLFWRPEDRGYTSNIAEAGRYTKEEAESRCHGGEQPVTMALASSYYELAAVHAELAALRDENARLKAEAEQKASEGEKDKARLDAVRLAALHEIAFDAEPREGRYVTQTIQRAHRILATGEPEGVLKTPSNEQSDAAMRKGEG